MTSEREQEIERICQATLDRPVAARIGFLVEACSGDEDLRRQVELLLAQEPAAGAFLETPAMTIAAQEVGAGSAALVAGQQIGAYKIVSVLGAGGMGEVYRALDATLRREVAIKVLPLLFTSDPARLARFEREAQTLASLNHPNIATIHGVEHVEGSHALVLELVEGETLSDRLGAARSGLPLAEALGIARQLAEALDAAHEKGIVHRDLKPANIKIRPDGIVKVLDFGLAKAMGTPGSWDPGHAQARPPTDGSTRDGVLLGTAGYTSPEQARGEVVDKRTDIWAFGCVLYEMLTGRAAFAAASLPETLSNVLKTEPDWARLPADTPDSVRRLLRRCLAKDRKRRLSDIRDAQLDLDEATVDAPTAARPWSGARGLERVSWAAALLLVAVLGVTGIVWQVGVRTSSPAQVRFEIESPATAYPDTLAISPDGKKIVFAATADSGRSQLWLRWLDAAAAQPLAGTEGGRTAFWSPDSRSVAFFASGVLKRVDVDTGTVLRLANSVDVRSGTWNSDGTILFSPGTGSLLRVSDRGGEVVAVSAFSANGIALMHPRFLPDGRHFLYDGGGSGITIPRGIHVAPLDGVAGRRLVDGASAEFAQSDYLLYTRDRTLFAQRFDDATFTVTGRPVRIAERVIAQSVASNGTLVFRSGVPPHRQLIWYDRSGSERGRVAGSGGTPTISPDGTRVVVARVPPDRTTRPDIAILDLAKNLVSTVTSGPFASNSPLWSPGGDSIVFTSPRNGKPFALFLRSAAGGGDERPLLELPVSVIPNAWSPDGRTLIYRRSSGGRSAQTPNGSDLWALSLEDGRTSPLVQTAFGEREAQFSPDGRWFAYQSNESGRFEIYIKPFPDDGRTRHQVSSDGGVQVRWPRNSRELFYFGLDDTLMAVPIHTSPTGDTVEAGSPVALFQARIGAGEGFGIHDYDVSSDGTRFLIDSLQEVTAPITVILNWSPAEEER